MRRAAARLEPWIVAHERAALEPRAPRVYLLVSWREAQALADGRVPKAVQRQATRALTWTPRSQTR